MGRTATPKYRLELKNSSRFYALSPMAWDVKTKGKPTPENIEKYVRAFVDSQKIGGCNQHLSKSTGAIQVPNYACIIRQADGQMMAEWKAPMFMAI